VAALSLYVPDFIGAFLPDDAPTRYMVTEAYFVAAVCSASLAYRLPGPLDFLSLGASLGVLYVRQEGKKWLNQQTIGEENADYVLHLAGEDYRPFFNLGVLAEVFPGVTLGFLYIMGADVDLAGRLDIELPPGVTEEDPLLAAAGGLVGHYRQDTFMRVPDGLGVGINWAVTRWLELSFDFRYWLYSQFKEQVVRHNIRLESLPGLVPEEFVTPKNYEDSWTTSLGALVRPFDDLPLEVMGGGSYDHSPAPNNTKSLDSPTVNLAGFSLGARYTLAERWRFSLTYYRYWYLKDRTTDSILVPPQNSEFSGSVDTFSVQTEVRF
jgi:long-subunit fatty acid transport protein